MSAPPPRVTRPQMYALFNAFIDGGWLAKLTRIQQGVWLAYLRHANSNGESWPGPTRIARYLRHKHLGHVCQARRVLVKLGLLVLIAPGGGRKRAKFRVTVPTAVDRTESAIPGSDPDPGPVQDGHLGRDRTSQEVPNSNGHPGPMPTGEGLNVNSHHHHHDGELSEVLSQNGVWPSVVDALIADFPALSAATARYLARQLKNVREPGAVLAHRIRQEGPHLAQLHQMALKEERIERRTRLIQGAVKAYELDRAGYDARVQLDAAPTGTVAIDEGVRGALAACAAIEKGDSFDVRSAVPRPARIALYYAFADGQVERLGAWASEKCPTSAVHSDACPTSNPDYGGVT